MWNSWAPAGRQPLAIVREEDWEKIVRGVKRFPKLARQDGLDKAIAWAEFELPSLIALVDLAPVETDRQAKILHAIKLYRTEGVIRAMARGDKAAWLRRRKLLKLVEGFMLERTFKWVFSHTPPILPSKYGRHAETE